MKTQYQQAARDAVRTGDFHAAAQAFSELARIEPENMEICIMAANMAQRAGLNDMAAKWYAHAARHYVQQRDLNQAVVMMKHYHQIRPTERQFCRQLFRCCRDMGEGGTLCLSLLHVEDRVCMAFRKHALFSRLDNHAFDELLPQIDVQQYKDAKPIAHAGEPAECLYLVAKGGIRPWIEIDGERMPLSVVASAEVCGEIPFLTGLNQRIADMEAVGDTVLICIPYQVLRELTRKYPSVEQQLDEYYRHHVLEQRLAQTPLFQTLGEGACKRICAEMENVHLHAGETLYQQGDTERLGLYVVRSGWLSVNIDIRGECHLLYTAKSGNLLGVTSLLSRQRRFFVRAVSDVSLMYWPEACYRRAYENHLPLRQYVAERMAMQQRAIQAMEEGHSPNWQETHGNLDQGRYLMQKIHGLDASRSSHIH